MMGPMSSLSVKELTCPTRSSRGWKRRESGLKSPFQRTWLLILLIIQTLNHLPLIIPQIQKPDGRQNSPLILKDKINLLFEVGGKNKSSIIFISKILLFLSLLFSTIEDPNTCSLLLDIQCPKTREFYLKNLCLNVLICELLPYLLIIIRIMINLF